MSTPEETPLYRTRDLGLASYLLCKGHNYKAEVVDGSVWFAFEGASRLDKKAYFGGGARVVARDYYQSLVTLKAVVYWRTDEAGGA